MAQKLQQQMTISRNTRTQKKDFSCSFPVLLTLELICRQSECKQELCIRIQNLSIVVKSSRVLCCVMQCHFLTNYQMTSVQQQHCSLSDDHPRIYLPTQQSYYAVIFLLFYGCFRQMVFTHQANLLFEKSAFVNNQASIKLNLNYINRMRLVIVYFDYYSRMVWFKRSMITHIKRQECNLCATGFCFAI